jgi:hypothetical protein
MPVERRRLHAEPMGQAAQGQALEPALVQLAKGVMNNQLPIQRHKKV